MSSSYLALALQSLESLLYSSYSEATQIQRATQADAMNFLDQIGDGNLTTPYILIVVSPMTNGEMGSDAARDLAMTLNVWYIRNGALTTAEKATYSRIEDWAADKARDLTASLYAWCSQSNGPFWVGEPMPDISAVNDVNAFFLGKELDFYAFVVAAEFECSAL